MRAKIRDTEIFFDIDGLALVPDGALMRERHTALLIHGGPGGDHTRYKAQWAKLSAKMQVVYFDLRGHGRSGRCDPQRYTLNENVDDIEALRQYLGLGPIVLIGASYGATVAMAYAARFADYVSHLVLIVAAAHSGYVERARQLVAERGSQAQISQCEDLFAGRIDTPDKMRRYFEIMGPLYAKKYKQVSGVSGGPTILEPEPQNRAHGPTGYLRTFDLRPELPNITAPTLIIAGRHDWIHAPEFSEEIHQRIADSDLRIFEHSGHSIGVDEPEALLDAVTGFLVYRTRRTSSNPWITTRALECSAEDSIARSINR